MEAEGFKVLSASDFQQVKAACEEARFQLAVIGHTLMPKIKRAIAAVIRDKTPRTPILELCLVSPEVPDADYVLIGQDPAKLVQMVNKIARESARRTG